MKQRFTLTFSIAVFTLCFLQNTVFAQEKPAVPAKNAFMMELNFKPFGENVISFNQLQIKYRVSDAWALRLGLALNQKSFNLSGDDYEPSNPTKITGSEKSTKIGILPGIEYHFLKNSKVSPYIGAEFSFFNQSVKSHYKDFQGVYDYNTGQYNYIPVEIDIKGATRTVTTGYYTTPSGYYYYTYTEYPDRAYTSVGGNLLVGCDFYFMRNVYVGVEGGLGYNNIRTKKVTIDISNEVKPTILPSYTDSNFGFYYNSALRLGFWF